MPSTPYVVGVELLKSGGAGREGVIVRITNLRTGETADATTNGTGMVVFDLANMTQGYEVGDLILIGKYVLDTDMEYNVAANGTSAVPSWVEVDNEVKTSILPSTTRFKLNTDRYGGGREIDFSLD